jgi:hypothetical protein
MKFITDIFNKFNKTKPRTLFEDIRELKSSINIIYQVLNQKLHKGQFENAREVVTKLENIKNSILLNNLKFNKIHCSEILLSFNDGRKFVKTQNEFIPEDIIIRLKNLK